MKHPDFPPDELASRRRPAPESSALEVCASPGGVVIACDVCGTNETLDEEKRPADPAGLRPFVAYPVPSGWFVSKIGMDPILVLCPPHAKARGKAGVP